MWSILAIDQRSRGLIGGFVVIVVTNGLRATTTNNHFVLSGVIKGNRMRIAVLCDGGGLARLGLEQAGHECTGYELDPVKHYLSQMVGSGNCILADIRDADLSSFDAVWASPPCQEHSEQNHGNRKRINPYADGTLLEWCLTLPHDVLWVENVINYDAPKWGTFFNAAQFLPIPVQKRRRQIGGRYLSPMTYREYKPDYRELDICPAVVASEFKQGSMARVWEKERRKATRWYGRPLSLFEMAYHQGFEIPNGLLRSWYYTPPFNNPNTGKPFTENQWRQQLCQAIGNGVPVYMARAFGAAYTGEYGTSFRQFELFTEIASR